MKGILNDTNIKYIKKWEKKYRFSGKLQAEGCKELVEKIEAKSKGNKKTLNTPMGMEVCRVIKTAPDYEDKNRGRKPVCT